MKCDKFTVGFGRRTSYLAARDERFSAELPLVVALLFCLVSTLVSISPVAAGIEEQQTADEYLPVDCLLPGTVRKLGGKHTFISPRRPVKTTAVNCEIRGGEYVVYDRADYKSALAVWQPLAEQGDPKAQNYVGEIHEKGLGTSPDFDLAATWYAMAAKKDYAPAQINLGQLYELGRGVDRSMDRAIDLYRKAAGIKGKDLRFVSWDYSEANYLAMSGQIADQQATLEAQQRKIEALTERLDSSIAREERLDAEISDARKDYRASLLELEQARQALEAQETSLLEAQQREPVVTGDNTAERALLDQERKQLVDQIDELNAERARLEQQQASLQRDEDRLQQREQALQGQASRNDQESSRLAEDNKALSRRMQALDARFAELEQLQTALAAQRQAIAQQEQLTNQKDDSAQAKLQTLAKQQAELERLKQDVERREGELASLSDQLTTERGQLEQQQIALKQDADQLRQREQALQGQASRNNQESSRLAQDDEVLSRRMQALDARFAELEELQSALEDQRLALAQKEQATNRKDVAAQAKLQSLTQQQKELERLKQDVDRREDELASREAALFSKSSELKRLNGELETLRQQLADNASAFAGTPGTQAEGLQAPVIEMIEPRLLATRGGQFVVKTRAGLDQRTIIGRVLSQSPIIELLVNDRNVLVDERGLFQERILIRGQQTDVTIVAIDKMGQRSDLSFVLGVEEPDQQNLLAENALPKNSGKSRGKLPNINFGNYHALLIGNQDYESMPDLDTSIYDTTSLRDVLRDRYGFKTTLLTDASRYSILSALEKLRQELTEDDNLLIYYAGHGELDKVNTRGHWLPVDAEEHSRANWISNVAISDILNSMSANKVLVVADSCYSGSMTRSTLARLDAGRTSKAWVSWLKTQAVGHSRLLFSSGGIAPVLDGGGGKHSIFAKAFLDVLRNNEGVIEGREVHAQVAQAVNYAAMAAQFEQTPLYAPIKFAGHEGGDFLFVAQVD